MMILGMTSKEYLKRLHTNGIEKCPECEKGMVYPVGNKETTHHFKCDCCRFKIEECVSR